MGNPARHSLAPFEMNAGSGTTVLAPGIVESRGHGPADQSRDEVSAEISSFLSGEAKFGVRAEVRSLFTVFMFITRLPVPAWIDLHPGFLMLSMAYFPLAGSVIGGMLAILLDFLAVSLKLAPSVAAVISTGAGLYLTGCFHEDGLADTADGLGGGWSRSQILMIMTDSRLGTFGVAALSVFLILKVEVLGQLGKEAGSALILSQTLARLSAPYLIRTRYYVPEVGPKSNFYLFMVQAKHLVSWKRVFFAAIHCFAVAQYLFSTSVAVSLIAAVIFFATVAGRYGQYFIGGVMGDFLGGTICISELLVLTLLLARESIGGFYRRTFAFILSAVDGDQTILAAVRELMPSLCGNEEGLALTRFVLLVLCLKIWCVLVGPPDMFQKESGAIIAKVRGDSQKEERGEPSPRDVAADLVCSESTTFQDRYNAAMSFLDSLAKPVGSLGTLEDWAARLAALQRSMQPDAINVSCLIFAGDHGAAAAQTDGGEGCSLYPQAVTRSVLVALERGVAGASVLAKSNNVNLRIVDVGVIGPPFESKAVISSPDKLAVGTRNFCIEPAMSSEECARCMSVGRQSVKNIQQESGSKVICLGEVGIGNTTSSSALIAALTGASVESLCGGGAFASKVCDNDAVSKKVKIVEKALALHSSKDSRFTCKEAQASAMLARLGGAEIAALVGAMLEASDNDVAVMADGFIVTAAALVAVSISPRVARVLILTSNSAERGQRAAIDRIQEIAVGGGFPTPANPALSMGLRMGEGTAALLAVPVLRSSAAVFSEMATLSDILE